jgi:hypothetical protein
MDENVQGPLRAETLSGIRDLRCMNFGWMCRGFQAMQRRSHAKTASDAEMKKSDEALDACMLPGSSSVE